MRFFDRRGECSLLSNSSGFGPGFLPYDIIVIPGIS